MYFDVCFHRFGPIVVEELAEVLVAFSITSIAKNPSVAVSLPPEVSASFKSGTSVSYTFKEPYEMIRNNSAMPSSIYSDTTLRGENVSLSFRTTQSPAMLFYVSSYYRESLALLINKHGEEGFILKELLYLVRYTNPFSSQLFTC